MIRSKLLLAAALTLTQVGGVVDSSTARAQYTPADEVLAQGYGGALTRDAADAFVEALEFIQGQVGMPVGFDASEKAYARNLLAANYANLPVADQSELANARALWTTIRARWSGYPEESKREFAHGVLRMVYGQATADQTVGTITYDSSSGGIGYTRPGCTGIIIPDGTSVRMGKC